MAEGIYSRRRKNSGIYSRRRRGAPKKNDDRGGILGLVENLGEDIADAVLGIPAGVKQTVTDPIKTVKQIGQSYAETYGPLVRGDIGGFLENLYEHPLGPMLDAATIATLGGAVAATVPARGAASVGRAGAAVRQIELRSPRAIATGEGPVAMGRVLSRNPVTRSRQLAVDRGLKRLPANTPVVGEVARYGREMDRAARQQAMSLKLLGKDYFDNVSRLGREEMAALNLLADGISPRDYARLLDVEGVTDTPIRAALENPKIQQLWEQPSERMVRAHEAATQLSLLDARVKVERGWLTPETVESSVGRARRTAEERLGTLDQAPLAPYYRPHKMTSERVANADVARMGGGAAQPRRSGALKRNEQVLLLTGRLALEPDTLGPEFLRTVKIGLHEDVHQTLMDGAIRIPRGQGLPEGHEYVRRPVISRTGAARSEKISYTQKNLGEFERDLERLLPDPDDTGRLADKFTTDEPDLAVMEGDNLLAVPTRLKRQVAGEFTRSNAAVRNFIEKPTQVWRALVLGYRPGFLVNNLVGNNFLYALAFAGPAGLRGYYDAVRTMRGESAARRMLNDPKTRDALDQAFMEKWFPEQVEGTFMQTQAPQRQRLRSPRGRKAVRRAGLGIVPATQAVAEGTLRRAAINTVARKSPAVRAKLKAMPKETRSFRKAAEEALEDNPGLQREWSQKVNAALGDYLNMSHAERTYIRAALPFWAWYRSITIITLKLAAESPARANLLSKIGQIGTEVEEDALGEVPSYLRGSVPVGRGLADALLGGTDPGLQPILTTGGINPLATPESIGRGIAAFLGGDPGDAGREIGGMLNPFLAGGIEQFTGTRLFSGADVPPGRVPGVAGGTIEGIAQNLPFFQLARGPSNLYPERDLRSQFLAFLGVPVKQLDRAEARRRARQERD